MSFEIRRFRGRSVLLSRVAGERLRIGRGTNADLRFDDAAVALEHAVLERDGASWQLTDRGSVTGTFVNGRRIDSVRLAAGDEVEIGEARLKVELPTGDEPAAPLSLTVRSRREEAAAAPEPSAEAPIDWVAAYRLRQGWLSKLGIAVAAVIVAVGVVLAVAAGRTTAFRPGPVSEAHASAIGAADCRKCHQPWRGPVDGRCTECHQGHTIHQARQVAAPPCGGCHFEHRGQERLTAVTDARCTTCHADLQVAGTGAPRFAERVTDFATDHPELAVEVRTDGVLQRLPLSDPAARTADPTTLRFSHAEHLKPGRVTPQGRVTLVCADCHTVEKDGSHLRPIVYEDHCQRCHLLNFELAFPEKVVPHAEPALVRGYLIGEYSGDDRWRSLSLSEKMGRIRRGGAPPVARNAVEAAVRAETDLYRRTCEKCHAVRHDVGSLPVLEAVAIPTDWLSHARFPHDRHEVGLECASCHAAEESREAADVLLPGIDRCRECHGASGRTTAGGGRVPTGCADCHDYHGGAAAEPTPVASAAS